MRTRLLHITFTVALLCSMLCSVFATGARSCVATEGGCEESVSESHRTTRTLDDRQRLMGGDAVITTRTASHVASSRPTRLLPTHGGKPGNTYFYISGNSQSDPLNSLTAPLRHRLTSQRMGDASPRRYYVIALRRLLC